MNRLNTYLNSGGAHGIAGSFLRGFGFRVPRLILSCQCSENLEKEEVDFALEVTSPDIAEPLKVKRQYRKNLNRILKVKTADETLEGTLAEVNEEQIVLTWKAREPKPIGKGKVTVEKRAEVAFQDIKEAKVKIIF